MEYRSGLHRLLRQFSSFSDELVRWVDGHHDPGYTLLSTKKITQLVKRTVVLEPYKLTQYVRRELTARPRSGRKTTSVRCCHLHRIMFDDIVLLFLPS